MHSCNSHRAEQNYAASLALCWGLARRKALCLISGSAATVLKFLITLEQRAHFCFVLGPAGYVVCPKFAIYIGETVEVGSLAVGKG